MTHTFFGAAYERGYQLTVRFLASRGIGLDQAAEFAQAAWSRAWEARLQLKHPEKLGAWVNRIALNEFCNEKRRQRRYADDETGREPAAAAGAVASLNCSIDAATALRHCSALDRSLLLDRYRLGLHIGEIARRHGLSDIATRVRLSRSRRSMRGRLIARPAPPQLVPA